MAWEEGLAAFREAFTRSHDDAVRLAFEAGKKAGATEEREACVSEVQALIDALDPWSHDDSIARHHLERAGSALRARRP